jgi:hypothetical protein
LVKAVYVFGPFEYIGSSFSGTRVASRFTKYLARSILEEIVLLFQAAYKMLKRYEIGMRW